MRQPRLLTASWRLARLRILALRKRAATKWVPVFRETPAVILRPGIWSGSAFRFKAARGRPFFPAAACLSVLCFCAAGVSSTESAIANGDTRIIRLYHAHTGESIEIAYRVNGHYDAAALEKLNWFLRDWRRNEETKMDPRLFDAVWEAYRAAGATQPVTVVCGYRSPQTNAMLRSRSRGVAEHSQHILGRAMDTTMPGMSMEKVREVAMRLQMGGVGYYASSNFVHIDVGGVRSWPRMNYDQLARLFPDGKTVHIAADGRTMPRYEEARAELQARGSIDVPPSSESPNLFAWLFSLGHSEDEREETFAAAPERAMPSLREAARSRAGETQVAQAADDPRASAAAPRSVDTSRAARAADKTLVASLAPPQATRLIADAEPANLDRPAVPPPLPPARPAELAGPVDVPLPPMRPGLDVATALTQAPVPAMAVAAVDVPPPSRDTPKKDPIGTLITASNAAAPAPAALPKLITQGSAKSVEAPPSVLAYASPAQIEGLRSAARSRKAGLVAHLMPSQAPAPMVPARLDQASFSTLTGSRELAYLPTQTMLGPMVTGLRQVAQNKTRLQAGSLTNVAMSAVPMRFAVAANDLPTDHFVGTPGVAYAAAMPIDDALALKTGE